MSGVLKKTLFDFLQSAQRHPFVASIIALIAVILLVCEALEGRTLQVVTYLTAVVLGAVVVDVSFVLFGKPPVVLPVKVPRTEITMSAALYLLAAATFAYRFSSSYPPHNIFSKLLFVAALLLFGLQIMLALFFLLLGYNLRDLGVRFWGFVPVPFVMMVCMALVALATPLRNTWTSSYREIGGSIWTWIRVGLFTAALPEEFFRMVWQTRAGKLLKNGAAAWLLASFLWAGLHWFIFAQGRSHFQTLFWLLDIIPYGLLLGYLTRRTQSILPAVLLHATKFVWLGNLG